MGPSSDAQRSGRRTCQGCSCSWRLRPRVCPLGRARRGRRRARVARCVGGRETGALRSAQVSPCHCPGRVRRDRAFALPFQLSRWFSKGRALLPTRMCVCCVRAGVRCARARRTRGVQKGSALGAFAACGHGASARLGGAQRRKSKTYRGWRGWWLASQWRVGAVQMVWCRQSRGVVSGWMEGARASEIGFYSHSRPWLRRTVGDDIGTRVGCWCPRG